MMSKPCWCLGLVKVLLSDSTGHQCILCYHTLVGKENVLLENVLNEGLKIIFINLDHYRLIFNIGMLYILCDEVGRKHWSTTFIFYLFFFFEAQHLAWGKAFMWLRWEVNELFSSWNSKNKWESNNGCSDFGMWQAFILQNKKTKKKEVTLSLQGKQPTNW